MGFLLRIFSFLFYDEIDLFKPAITDKYTGYRYYNDEQVKEFDKITKYKDLGFTLEEIKELLKGDNIDKLYLDKINQLSQEINEREDQLIVLRNMLRRLPNIEFRAYHEKYKIGKRVTLKKTEDYFKELEPIKKELDELHIEVDKKVVCYFEVGYVDKDIDCFIGYTLKDNIVPENIGSLEIILNSKSEKKLIGHGYNPYIIFEEMIEYAHNHNIQIRDFATGVRNDDSTWEVYVEAYDLEEVNEDELYFLDHFHTETEIDPSLVGTYEIREILPNIKYMFNPNKQKSPLDTKYKVLELKEDGTTNYENITWNKKHLLLKYENR